MGRRNRHFFDKTAGEILEIYAYYEILKMGYFVDIVTGFDEDKIANIGEALKSLMEE